MCTQYNPKILELFWNFKAKLQRNSSKYFLKTYFIKVAQIPFLPPYSEPGDIIHPVFLNVNGTPESISRSEFRQPM